MERYFYFGELAVETTGEACMYPLSSFLGMTPTGSDGVKMHFKSRNGELTDDDVDISFSGTTKNFMSEVVRLLQRNQKNPFIVMGSSHAYQSGPANISSLISRILVTTAA